MYKISLAVVFAIVSNSANAEWTYVGRSSDGNPTIYADLATIRKSGSIVKMWTMSDYNIVQKSSNGKQYLSAKTQDEYDCKEETSGILAFTTFSENMGNGNPISSDSGPANKKPISPESLIEAIWKIACAKN